MTKVVAPLRMLCVTIHEHQSHQEKHSQTNNKSDLFGVPEVGQT